MSHGVATAERQAELLKDQGNSYFKKERLGAAIEAYTEAITLCPSVPVYWTNRALCHRKRNDWGRVESDCRKALELDKDSVKAHYMLGLALLQSQLYGEAVKQLEKALELGRGGKPGSYMVEEIWQELAKARYTEWEQGANHRKHLQQDLRELCENLLKEDYEKQIREVSSSSGVTKRTTSVEVDGVIHLDDYDTDSSSNDLSGNETTDSSSHTTKMITEQYNHRRQMLSEVFDKARAPDIPTEVPDHLQCQITMDIFRDPVITSSGVTYERAILLQHLQKVGKFDPLTRAPLQPEQIVPNLAIKEAVQNFLAEHGWAYKTF